MTFAAADPARPGEVITLLPATRSTQIDVTVRIYARTVPMSYRDGHEREMAKWAHQRIDAARRRAEVEQRRALDDSTNHPAAQPDNS